MADALPHYPAVVRCPRCGRSLPVGRAELLGHVRSGLPACCGLEMGLYILAERPGPDDKQVVALPGSSDGTDIIPVPQPRKLPD